MRRESLFLNTRLHTAHAHFALCVLSMATEMSQDFCGEAGSERLLREHALSIFVYAEHGEDETSGVLWNKLRHVRQGKCWRPGRVWTAVAGTAGVCTGGGRDRGVKKKKKKKRQHAVCGRC